MPPVLIGLAPAIIVPLLALQANQAVVTVALAGVLGFCGGLILVICFALPAMLAAPTEVARMSAGIFTISSTTSFVANVLAGAVWDSTQVAASAFLPALLGGVLVLVLGPRLITGSALFTP